MTSPADGGSGTLTQDTAEMRNAVSHIDSTSSQIRGLMSSISTTVSDASAWQGDTAVAFQQSMSQWHEAATKMDRVLQEIQEGVHGSDVSVNAQESDNVSNMQRVGGAITFGL